MRPWEQRLKGDEVAWTDFLAWLTELAQGELERMLSIDAKDHEYQRGLINGIHAVKYAATAHDKEDDARAKRQRA